MGTLCGNVGLFVGGVSIVSGWLDERASECVGSGWVRELAVYLEGVGLVSRWASDSG